MEQALIQVFFNNFGIMKGTEKSDSFLIKNALPQKKNQKLAKIIPKIGRCLGFRTAS